jgi:hypothetical protein
VRVISTLRSPSRLHARPTHTPDSCWHAPATGSCCQHQCTPQGRQLLLLRTAVAAPATHTMLSSL